MVSNVFHVYILPLREMIYNTLLLQNFCCPPGNHGELFLLKFAIKVKLSSSVGDNMIGR